LKAQTYLSDVLEGHVAVGASGQAHVAVDKQIKRCGTSFAILGYPNQTGERLLPDVHHQIKGWDEDHKAFMGEISFLQSSFQTFLNHWQK
jgi:hypothetical protein